MINSKILKVGIISLSLLLSCQIGNNLGKTGTDKNSFRISSTNPNPEPSSGNYVNYTLPPDLQDIDTQTTANLLDIKQLSTKKEKIDFDTPPPEDLGIVNGKIWVFYHNNDKFRVRTTNSVNSSNQSYSKKINKILKKYHAIGIRSAGYYDPADATKIICKGSEDSDDDDKDHENEKNFKTKDTNNKNSEHDKDKSGCDTLNYSDSSITTQKIAEEQSELSKHYEGEFPDKLSVHIYEFPENVDTRKIAKEIKSLPFVRNSYPELKVGNFSTSCDLKTDIIGYSDRKSKIFYPGYSGQPVLYSETSRLNPRKEYDKDPYSYLGAKDTIFSYMLGVPYTAASTDIYDWYWFNHHNIFKGWQVYADTEMPKIAVIDTGFDNEPNANNFDKPNYVGGFSVIKKIDTRKKNSDFDNISVTQGDIQEEINLDPKQNFSHGHFVSSVIGSPKNDIGSVGISPNAQILPVKMFSNNIKFDALMVSRAIEEVTKDSSIDVINLSSGPNDSKGIEAPAILDPYIRASMAKAVAIGKKIVVIAAGNMSRKCDESASLDGVIVVGGVTNKNSSDNSRNENTYITSSSSHGSLIDIGASSEAIVGTKFYPSYPEQSKRGYDYEMGTSISAPMISSASGMVKKLAKANGVDLTPNQVKHIICYSASLYYDENYKNSRYIGIDLTDILHSRNGSPNIRSLNLYNALTIAKNLGKYSFIIRQHNVDDYIMSTNDYNWGNSFDFTGYKSDEIIGIDNPYNYKLDIDFKTLNNGGGYAFGYQIFSGKKYQGINSDQVAGYALYDEEDGAVGSYGAEKNRYTGYGYLAGRSLIINPLSPSCSSLSFTTKASSLYGTNINGTISNQSNTLAQDVKSLKTFNGSVIILGVSKNLSNSSVLIDGVNQTIIGKTSTAIAFSVSNLTLGTKNVMLSTSEGSIVLPSALDIQNKTNKFPSSITINGITTTLDYGFNFDFNEESGNTVFDKSGNNNNATLGGFNGTFPERFSLADGSTGLRFTNESYLRVPDNDSYEMPNSFTFLSKIKINEINKYQTLLIKGSGVSGLLDSYVWSIDEQNRITLSLFKAGNTNPCTLFTQSVPLYLVTNPLNIQPNETIGLAVSFDQKNKVLKFYKNQTELSYTVAYPIPNSICGNVYDYNRLPDSPLDLYIGSYVYDNGTLHYPDSNLQELYLIANVKKRALNGSEVGKIFYDLGLKD